MFSMRSIYAEAKLSWSQIGQLIRPQLVSQHRSFYGKESNLNFDISDEVQSTRRRRHPHPIIDRIVRVNQAGERGAVMRFSGQLCAIFKPSDKEAIKHMQKQEKEHVQFFENEINERRVRPSLMLPVWDVAGFALGIGTALMGKEAAMACTVAVEEVIEDHYNNQLRELMAEEIGDTQLLEGISKCRDEELQHMEVGIERGALEAPGYDVLTQVIKTSCRLSIWLAERI